MCFVAIAVSKDPRVFVAAGALGALAMGYSPTTHSLSLELYTRRGGAPSEAGKLFGAMSVIQTVGCAPPPRLFLPRFVGLSAAVQKPGCRTVAVRRRIYQDGLHAPRGDFLRPRGCGVTLALLPLARAGASPARSRRCRSGGANCR